MKNALLILLLLAIGSKVSAQDTLFNSKYFKSGLYYFEDTFKLEKSNIFTTYKSQFGLGCNDSMSMINEGLMDSIDTKSSRYKQYHKGYPVEISMMNVISKYGVVLYTNGFVVKHLNVNVSSPISESSALSNALTYVSAPEYAWQDSAMENNLKIVGADTTDSASSALIYDTNATYYPKGQLVIAHLYGDTSWNDTSKYKLCWKFTITPMRWDTVIADTSSDTTIVALDTTIGYEPLPNVIVYVNAITGDIYALDSNMHSSFWVTCGIHPTWYNGNQNVQANTCTICWNYRFYDSRNIKLYRYGDQWGITKSGTNNENEKNTGFTAYWELEQAWNYYYVKHGFAGTHGWNNFTILYNDNQVQNDYGLVYQPGTYISANNTDWTGYDMFYVSPDIGWPAPSYAQLDLMGHEYTHAMIAHSSNLLNSGESAAIAEGFSDYFGVMTAAYVNGYAIWGMGVYTYAWVRYFNNPNYDSPYPGAAYYLDNTGGAWSYGDPHSRSGVLRHFLYLLNYGGTYNGYTIHSAPNVETNAFVTMEWWCWSNMNYSDLLNSFQAEFAYYYGTCSPQWKSVVTAWAAVQVGTPPSCKRAYVYGQRVATSDEIASGSVNFKVTPGDESTSITSYSWTIPGSWTTHTSSDNSTLYIDAVSNNNSQFVSCTVTYGDGSSDVLTTFLHIVDCETGDCDLGRKTPPAQNAGTQANEDVQIFPNPASNKLNIVIPGLNENAALQILDVAGKEIYHKNITQSNSLIFLPSAISQGVYIIKISNSKLNVVRKIVIE